MESSQDKDLLILINSSSQIIIDNMKEFLDNFVATNLYDSKVLSKIQAVIVSLKEIGATSRMSKVFEIPDTNMVIKISKLCDKTIKKPNKLQKELCKIAKEGDLIFRFPHTTDNKVFVLTPNYLIEMIFTFILTSSNVCQFTAGIPKTYGVQYDIYSEDKNVYMISEKLQLLDNRIVNINTLLSFITQLSQILNVLQINNCFTHWDLHIDNVMVRPVEREVNVFTVGENKYIYTYLDFDVVLIDFGWSRLETNDNIVSGRVSNPRPKQGHIDIFEHGRFNPYIDLYECLVFVYLSLKLKKNDIFSNWREENKINYIKEFLSLLLNIHTEDLDDVIENHINVAGVWWRAAPEKLAMSYTCRSGRIFSRCLSPFEFLSVLYARISSIQPMNTLEQQLDEVLVLKSDTLYQVSGKHYDLPNSYQSKLPQYYNYTSSINNVEGSPITVHSFTFQDFSISIKNGIKHVDNSQQILLATIDTQNVSSQNYSFVMNCCDIDTRIYSQSNIGISINGSSYFSDFRPFGNYKKDEIVIESLQPINDEIKQYYSLVAIDDNNIVIDRNIDNFKSYSSAMTCGPLLLYDRIRIIDSKILKEEILNTPTGLYGDISHSSSLEQRTILVVMPNNEIRFIFIIKDENNLGMNCAMLSKICYNMGALHAICLNHGPSTQMSWRFNDEVSVAKSAQSYPVSNILSFVLDDSLID